MNATAYVFQSKTPFDKQEAIHLGNAMVEFQLTGCVVFEDEHTYVTVMGSRKSVGEFKKAFRKVFVRLV